MLNFVKEGDTMFFEVNISMNNSNSIVSAALLDAIWEESHKDVIDLLIPFVIYILSENFSINDIVDKEKTSKCMKEKFGFTYMPNSVMDCVFKRLTIKENNRILCRNKGSYQLRVNLDADNQKFKEKYNYTKNSTDNLLKLFVDEYNKSNRKKIKTEEAQKLLIELLNDRGYDVLIEPQELNGITINDSGKKNFCLAQFLIKILSDENNEFYDVVTGIASGALLSNIVYIDTDVTEYKNLPLKNLTIYFDTSLLLFALGYKTEYQKSNMRSIIEMLKTNGAKLCYFPNNLAEVISILTAYKYRNENSTGQTLEYFDEKSISGVTVDYYIEGIENSLKDIGLEKKDLYDYPHNASEYNYSKYEIIDEENLMKFLQDRIDKYTEEQVKNDVACIASVCRERKGNLETKLERAEAIWVTSNINLIKNTTEFLKFPDKRILPVVSVYDLSTEIWLKYGFVDKSIPKYRLYENAQMALTPTKQVIEKCREKVDILENAGKIEPDVAAYIRYNRTFNRNIMLKIEGDEEEIDDELIESEIESFVDRITNGKETLNKQLSEENAELSSQKENLLSENELLRKQLSETQRMQKQKKNKQKEDYKNSKNQVYDKIRNVARNKAKRNSKMYFFSVFILCAIIGLSIIIGEAFLAIYGMRNEKQNIFYIAIVLAIISFIFSVFKVNDLYNKCLELSKHKEESLYIKYYKKEERKRKDEIELVEKMKDL